MPDNSITILRLESGPTRATQYMEHIKMEVANEKIVKPLIARYTELGAAKSFIDTIGIEDNGYLKIDLLIDHPIAQWLEFGTKRHWISANEAPMLNFEFKKTSAWFDSHASDSGDWFSGFEVDHPGFPGYQLLAVLLNTLTQAYIYEMVKRTNDFLERSKMK